MRKAVLFIAMSLDGYIADSCGKVDWLQGHGGPEEPVDSYAGFIQEVDTVVMGWNTYHQVVTELSPDEWVYGGLTSYVITHRRLPSTGAVRFVAEEPCQLVERLRAELGKTIWICGGAAVIRPLIARDLIDEYDISLIPTILGGGVRLFGDAPAKRPLRLLRSQSGDGIVELVYAPRRAGSPRRNFWENRA